LKKLIKYYHRDVTLINPRQCTIL